LLLIINIGYKNIVLQSKCRFTEVLRIPDPKNPTLYFWQNGKIDLNNLFLLNTRKKRKNNFFAEDAKTCESEKIDN